MQKFEEITNVRSQFQDIAAHDTGGSGQINVRSESEGKELQWK